MSHRIKPGSRYMLAPSGPIYENVLPHDIIVDRQPIFVGGRVEPKTISFGPGALFSGGRKIADVLSCDIESHAFDTSPYLRAEQNLIRKRWLPSVCNVEVMAWPSPKKDPAIPAFVAPERPVEPEAPQPDPDTPAVATLKALLADRQRQVYRSKAAVDGQMTDVVALEVELTEARNELAHSETVLAAAEAEVKAVLADIKKLGGKVEVQS